MSITTADEERLSAELNDVSISTINTTIPNIKYDQRTGHERAATPIKSYIKTFSCRTTAEFNQYDPSMTAKDQELYQELYNKFENMKQTGVFLIKPFQLYPIIFDFYERKHTGYKKLLQHTLFLNKNSPMVDGLPYPLDKDTLYTVLCEDLLDRKIICYDTENGIYIWNPVTCLFKHVNKPESFQEYMKEHIMKIRMLLNNIVSTLNVTYTGEFEQFKDELKHLVINNNTFNKITGHTTSETAKHMFNSLRSLKSKYPDNQIEWLIEQGKPGYLPFSDNKVLNLRVLEKIECPNIVWNRVCVVVAPHEQCNSCNMVSQPHNPCPQCVYHLGFEDRKQEHAFCDNISLLTRRFTSEEFMKGYNKWRKTSANKFQDIMWNLSNGDVDTFRSIMHVFGVSLTGTPDKRLWCLYSAWHNSGKSLIGKLLKLLLGSKCKSSDHSLISGADNKCHQTEKVSLITFWLTIMDETEETFDYKLKEVQLLTGGDETEVAGRKARADETKEGKLTTTLLEMSNYISGNTARKCIIALLCGFCSDPNDPDSYPESWWANKDARELIKDLDKPDVKKTMQPNLFRDIKYSIELKLQLVIISVFHALDSIQNQAANDKIFRSAVAISNGISPTLQKFIDSKEVDMFKQRDNESSLASDLVNIREYYMEYVKFTVKSGDMKLSMKNVKLQLGKMNLMRDDIHTEFLNNAGIAKLNKFPYDVAINSYWMKLPEMSSIEMGVPAPYFHNWLLGYIDYINNNMPFEFKNKFFKPKATEIVDYMVVNEYRNRSGKSKNSYHYNLAEIQGYDDITSYYEKLKPYNIASISTDMELYYGKLKINNLPYITSQNVES